MRLFSNKIYLIIAFVTLVVLGAAFVLGLMSSNKMREVISDQFNQQQLIIAKSVASDIEEKFDFIKNEAAYPESFSSHPIPGSFLVEPYADYHGKC